MKIDRKILYGLGVYFGYRFSVYIYRTAIAYKINRKAKAKRADRDKKITELPKIEAYKKQWILSLTLSELAAAIKEKKITSVEVTATYIERAYAIGRKLELTAEELFDEALAQARICDEILDKNPEKCGPLHGLPISIKDHYSQIGCTSSAGCA